MQIMVVDGVDKTVIFGVFGMVGLSAISSLMANFLFYKGMVIRNTLDTIPFELLI